MMIKSLCYVSLKVINLPYYDGFDVDNFLDGFEKEVPENHHFQAFHLALHTTLTWWWGMHKDNFYESRDYRRIMRLQSGHPKFWLIEIYEGRDDSRDNFEK